MGNSMNRRHLQNLSNNNFEYETVRNAILGYPITNRELLSYPVLEPDIPDLPPAMDNMNARGWFLDILGTDPPGDARVDAEPGESIARQHKAYLFGPFDDVVFPPFRLETGGDFWFRYNEYQNDLAQRTYFQMENEERGFVPAVAPIPPQFQGNNPILGPWPNHEVLTLYQYQSILGNRPHQIQLPRILRENQERALAPYSRQSHDELLGWNRNPILPGNQHSEDHNDHSFPTLDEPVQMPLLSLVDPGQDGSSKSQSSGSEEQDPYECTKCGKSYHRKDSLIYHVRAHHSGERPHPCSMCNKAFITRSHLARHLRRHANRKTYHKCELCDLKFKTVQGLGSHKRCHKLRRSNSLSSCFTSSGPNIGGPNGSSSSSRGASQDSSCHQRARRDLKQQNRFQKEKRKYPCPYPYSHCSFVCKSLKGLHLHMKTHRGVKSLYWCTVCGINIPRKDNLKRHIRKKHKEYDNDDVRDAIGTLTLA